MSALRSRPARARGAAAGRLGPALAGVLLVASCAAPHPEPVPPPIEAPAAWTEAHAGDGRLAPDWWTAFRDPRLDTLVARALARNHDLEAAAARLAAAIAQGRIAGAELWPTLDASLGADRQRRVFVGFPFGAGVPSITFNQFGVSLATSWELDLWGRVRAGRNAAQASAEAAAADYAAAALSIAGQTCKAWFAAVEAKQQVALADRTVESHETTVARVRQRFARGVGDAVDVRLAESALATARAQAQQRRDALQAALRQVQALAGDYPDAALDPGDTLPPPPPPVPAGLPADLVARRPDLVAAERRVLAARFRTDAARAALYPRIALTGSLGTTTDEFADLLDGDFFVWSIAGNLLQPLFAGGRLRAQVEADEAAAREALAWWSSLVLAAYREVEQALASERHAAAQREALVEAVRQAGAAEALAEQRYDRGLASFLEVLEAQRRALAARTELLAVERRRLDLRVDLCLALGGGFGPESGLAATAGSEKP